MASWETCTVSKDWTPSDRDYAIRTIVGEAANEPDDGVAAVAHVIANRARSGKYGGNRPTDVVLARGQFEPWSTRREELLALDDKDPAYARAAQLWDDAVANPGKDPTGGATHFLNEDVVMRRSGKLPKWATGDGQKLGAHTFYGGKRGSDDGIFDEFSRSAKPAAAAAKTPDDVFDEFSRGKPKTETPGTGRPRVVIPTDVPPATFTERMVDSMPIVGPLMNNLTAAAGAGLQATVNPLRRVMGKDPRPELEGTTFGERYEANKKSQDERVKKYGEEHPVAAVVADVAGPGMLFGPLGQTAVGARMLGMTGTSLGTKVLQAAPGMAAIETGNQLLRGNDPREQGLLGPVPLAAAGGAVAPVIGEAVGAGLSKVADMLPRRTGPLAGTNSVARNKLTGAMDGETPASIAASREAHEPAGGMLMDTNRATRDIAGGLADIPGPHKGEIREALRQRLVDTAPRMAASLDKNTVPHVNIRQLEKTIDTMQDAASKPLYDAFRATKIHPTQEIKDLIPRLEKAGAFKLADELAGIAGRPTTENFFTTGSQKAFPTAETWDYVKRGLDRRISTALDSGDKELGRELTKLKKEMLNEVEKTDGGKTWKKARETFAEYAEMKHQIEEGQKTWLRKTRVDDLAEELSLLSNNERAARVQGARDAVQEIMDATTRGDARARDALLSRAGREKLELLFGEKKAGRLIKDLEAEVNVRQSNYEMVGNSETSSKQARRNALLPQQEEPGYLRNIKLNQPATLIPDWMTPSAMMEGASAARHSKAYEQLSNLLRTRMDDPGYEALVAEIMAEGARRSAQQVRLGRVGEGAGTAVQATAPALRNRLLRPPEGQNENGGRR